MSEADDKTRRYRKQDAVWWVRTGFDANGRPKYAAPVDIKVRWTDLMQEVVGPDGTKFMSNAQILTAEDMKVGDRLRLGTIADLLPGKTAIQQPDSADVRRFEKIPDRRAGKFVRRAHL